MIIGLMIFNASLKLCLSPFLWLIFNDFLQRLQRFSPTTSTTFFNDFSNSSRLQYASTAPININSANNASVDSFNELCWSKSPLMANPGEFDLKERIIGAYIHHE
jgi:hypothetical protein